MRLYSNVIMIAFMISLCGCECMLSNTLNYLQNCALFLIKIKRSKVWSVSLQQSGLKILPPILKSLSTGAKEAGTTRYCSANLVKHGYVVCSVSSIVKFWYHECCMKW